jgi:hypothetical protein
MKRLVLGFGLGVALAYGWQRLAESGPTPSSRPWEETDNDPEDAVRGDLAGDLAARTREVEQDEAETEEAQEAQAPDA